MSDGYKEEFWFAFFRLKFILTAFLAGKLALRGIELRRMRHPEVIMVASGGQPAHVEPDGCCDGVPYNHGMKCCCNGALTDNCPCQAVTKAVTEA